MSELIKYEAACRALADAAQVDEVLSVLDAAAAAKAYARQAKNRDLEILAMEIRLQAERRLGELLRQQKEAGGLNAGGRPRSVDEKTGSAREPVSGDEINGSDEEPVFVAPTLADMGIDTMLSMQSQQLAAVPDSEFEQILDKRRQAVASADARAIKSLNKAATPRKQATW